MSARTTATGTTGAGGRRVPGRWVIAALLLALVVGALVVVLSDAHRGGGGKAISSDNSSATSLSTVTRGSLSERTQVNGTLGYARSYTVLGRVLGTITWLPSVGQVIRRGHVLYRVDGKPVVLLTGATPAWRTLADGAPTELVGADVAQLNHNLVALGYVDRADVDSPWADFGWATRIGVEKLQGHLGVDLSGRLALGDVVFLPTAARVTALQATLGGAAGGTVLRATSTTPTVNVELQAGSVTEVKTGDRVATTMPDGSTSPGRVTSVGTVAAAPADASSGSGGSVPTVPVRIRLLRLRTTSGLDQAPVQVTITNRTLRNVLAVPVTALLARAGGGYAVEVADGDGSHRLVPVTTGLFDDAAGAVQVTGPGLVAGLRVVVPGNE